MKTRLHIVLATCALMLLAVGDTYGQIATATSGVCYATTGGSSGDLYTIDMINGASTIVGTSGLGGLPGLAIDSDGNIFATERFTGDLYRVDAVDGSVAFVGTMDGGEIGALAFDSTDTLYGVSPYGDFVTIDTSSGAWSTIRYDPQMSHYTGLAFDSLGTLYGSTGNTEIKPAPVVGIDSIGIIDPLNGAETLVGEIGFGGGTPDIAFDKDGNLYGTKGGGRGANSLILIDQSDGSFISTVGSIAVGVSGLACYNAPVEPPPPTDDKVYVCHRQGKKGKTKTLHVDASSLQDHLDHGDEAGECDPPDVANGDKGKGKGKGKKNGKFDVSAAVPESFSLSQNYPNPFNPNTTISFALPEAASVRLAVYNAVGQEVKVLVSSTLEAGAHTATWDATDRAGQRVATGMYIYRLTTGTYVETRKMLLLE